MKKYILIIIGIAAVALLLVLANGQGQAQQAVADNGRAVNPDAPAGRSPYIPIQGRLTDASGNPLTGYYDVTFRLYDQFLNGIPLCTSAVPGIEVVNGLFIAYIDATDCIIDGRQLYLGVQVGTDAEMTPRQYIDNVAYAWSLRPGANISGTLGSQAIIDIENYGTSGRGLRSYAMATTSVNYGVVGATRSPDGFGGYFYNTGGGIGLYGSTGTYDSFGIIGLQADAYSLDDYTDFYDSGGFFGGVNGVIGISHETVRVGAGVYGWAQAATGTSYGVRGEADSTSGMGVYGHASASSGITTGIYGSSQSPDGRGITGYASATSGTTYGVYGESNSGNGRGVYGLADTSGGVGVMGESAVGSGVYGTSTTGYGMYASTQNASNNYGLYTPDNLYSLNYHLSGAVRQLVQNSGSEPLEAGDVVVFSGMLPPADANDPPVILVAKANSANSTAVAGVVFSHSTEDGTALGGAAQPGDYLLIVVQGPALVKASAAAGAIQVGNLLSSSDQPGIASGAAKITIQGIQTSIPGTVFAKALEALDSGESLIYVYVTLQ